LKSLIETNPLCKDRIAVVELGVTNVPDDIKAAVKVVKNQLRNKKLYGIVNNAGTGLAHENTIIDDIVDVNVYGVKMVTEAFLPLLAGENGRIVI